MNRAGYNVGTRSVARAYKRNVAANNPGQRTGLETRTDLAKQKASAVVSAIRERAVQRGTAVAASVNRGANNIVGGGAKLGMRAESVASAVRNAPRAALSATAAKGKTFGQGVRMGSRMPDASLSKVYSAQRYADPSGINKSVTRVSHATALTTAAGYGVGKAARRTVQGVNAIQDAPGNATRSMFSASRRAVGGLISTAGKVAGGFRDAAKFNRTLQTAKSYAMNAANNRVMPGIERFNRGAEKVFMGIGKGVGYAAAAPSLAVYHGGKAIVNGVKSNIAASARMKVASDAAMKSPRMTRAAGFGQAGKFTPMGNNSVVQAVRIKNAQNGGVYRGQAPKPQAPQAPAKTPMGRNVVLQKARQSTYMSIKKQKGQPHPLRQNAPAPSIHTKSASSGSFMGQASGRGQAMAGTPANITPLKPRPLTPNPKPTPTITAPWQSASANGSTRWNLKTRARGALASRQARATRDSIAGFYENKEGSGAGLRTTPASPRTRTVMKAAHFQSDGGYKRWIEDVHYTATGVMTPSMSARVSDVVSKAKAARGGRPATATEKVWHKGKIKGERAYVARAGARQAEEQKQVHLQVMQRASAAVGPPRPQFNLDETTSRGRGRPKGSTNKPKKPNVAGDTGQTPAPSKKPMVGYHGGSFHHRGKPISEPERFDRNMQAEEAIFSRQQLRILKEVGDVDVSTSANKDQTISKLDSLRAKYPQHSRYVESIGNQIFGTPSGRTNFPYFRMEEERALNRNPTIKRARARVAGRRTNV
jgi:hypothetical protein